MSPERQFPATSHRPPAQEGSAYMIVLMLLFVLTIVGVGLSIVTQTEIIVGSNERTIERVFYAADSGMGVAEIRILENKLTPFVFDVKGSASNAAVDAKAVDRVGIYPTVLINDEYCNLSMINQGHEIYALNYGVTVEATRFIGETGTPKNPVEVIEQGLVSSGSDGSPIASKSLSVMAENQCMTAPENNEMLIDADPLVQQAVLAKIKF